MKKIYLQQLYGVLGLIAFTLMNNQKKNEAKTAIVAKNASVSKIETVKTEEVSLDFSVNGF
jgi:hypothetical protein